MVLLASELNVKSELKDVALASELKVKRGPLASELKVNVVLWKQLNLNVFQRLSKRTLKTWSFFWQANLS